MTNGNAFVFLESRVAKKDTAGVGWREKDFLSGVKKDAKAGIIYYRIYGNNSHKKIKPFGSHDPKGFKGILQEYYWIYCA